MVPGVRVLFVSSKSESIYRRHCNPAVCKVSITALALRPTGRNAYAWRLSYMSVAETHMEKALGWSLQASLPGWSSEIVAYANSNDS